MGRRQYRGIQSSKLTFDVWFVITGYGKDDGCTPVDVKVTNLDGDEIDMTKGILEAISNGTYASR